jgi:uncharacterized protein
LIGTTIFHFRSFAINFEHHAVFLCCILRAHSIFVGGEETGIMRRDSMMLRLGAILATGLLLLGLWDNGLMAKPKATTAELLIFSHTAGFRHKSIPQGISSLTLLAARKGYTVTATEDLEIFKPDRLKRFRAIILLSNTTKPDQPESDYLTGEKLQALKSWSEAGGAIVGIHAATDSHFHTPWYSQMIGAQFKRHPKGTYDGVLTVTAPKHPAVRRLGKTFTRNDEWYQLRAAPVDAEILVTVDPASAGEPGPAWPVSWITRTGKGRNFITTMGHTPESFTDPLFMNHVEDGLDWAVGKHK